MRGRLVDVSRYNNGRVAKLVDALALGASVVRHEGSSPSSPIIVTGRTCMYESCLSAEAPR